MRNTFSLATSRDQVYLAGSRSGKTMAEDRGNLLAAGVLAAFGCYVIWVAMKLPYVSDVGPGPGFFPLWLGIGLVLFSFALMFPLIKKLRSEVPSETHSWKPFGRALAGWLAVMIAIALLGKLGFALTFVALTVFLIVALDRRSPLLALAVGIGLAAAFHILFVVALDVSLPKAVWGF
jgi:putative tricarboxylic transport membrane protein